MLLLLGELVLNWGAGRTGVQQNEEERETIMVRDQTDSCIVTKRIFFSLKIESQAKWSYLSYRLSLFKCNGHERQLTGVRWCKVIRAVPFDSCPFLLALSLPLHSFPVSSFPFLSCPALVLACHVHPSPVPFCSFHSFLLPSVIFHSLTFSGISFLCHSSGPLCSHPLLLVPLFPSLSSPFLFCPGLPLEYSDCPSFLIPSFPNYLLIKSRHGLYSYHFLMCRN